MRFSASDSPEEDRPAGKQDRSVPFVSEAVNPVTVSPDPRIFPQPGLPDLPNRLCCKSKFGGPHVDGCRYSPSPDNSPDYVHPTRKPEPYCDHVPVCDG